MTKAFRVNLTALSLLALVVGLFLIYNTMTFAVVQRRHLLAVLRAIGTTRRQILLLIVSEALLLGLLGTIIGQVAGIALGKSLVGLVTTTVASGTSCIILCLAIWRWRVLILDLTSG